MSINEFQILLIDDDEDDFINIRDITEEITRSKYRITWRSSYEAGLAALHEKKFDACLLDFRLGARTGLELLQEMHKHSLHCPTILLTGLADFDLDLQAMQTGAADYLVKGQLTAPLLERSIRYSMKHEFDMHELRESKAQILHQDRLASLGLLASSLAHEIGTPLGIIRSRAELIERKAADSLKLDMKSIIAQIDKITKLVNSLLNLAREKKSDFAVPVEVNTVIQDVLNLTRHEFERNGIEFSLSSPPDCWVMAESAPLGQVMLNLLVNAVHAIEDAKKKGRTDGHRIVLNIKCFADSAEISIQDSGCGIPEENFSQLFKPFYTTKDIGSGTGLGLAICFKLVQSWGGTIDVKSEIDKGSRFTVKLLKSPK